jgi:alpha-1,4-digalacturonate transport system substrate-binding protein
MPSRVSRRLILAGAALGFAAFAGPAFAQAPVELRMQCYGDGNECEVTQALLDRFQAENKDVRVTMDVVPYKAIQESLPVQLAAGEGPDMARVTDMGGLNKYYLDLRPHLKDAAYWDTNFGPILEWLQAGPEDKGIYGFPTQLTITGPYVNKTLFDQAGVALPGEGATWDDWAEASRKVAEATGTPFAMVMDRSGHRIAGPAISHGAKFFGPDGKPAVVDEGFKAMTAKFVEWHQNKAMPMEVWGGTGGGSYADALEQFTNASVVFLLFGQLADAADAGDDRRRVRLGGGSQSVRAGRMHRHAGRCGAVAFKHTKHPEQVARVMDFFASDRPTRS